MWTVKATLGNVSVNKKFSQVTVADLFVTGLADYPMVSCGPIIFDPTLATEHWNWF